MIVSSYKPFLATGGKGFTIIELLVAIGILGIVAGVGVQIFLTVSKSFAKAQIVSELQQEGSRVIAEISRVVKDAARVEANITGDTTCAGGGAIGTFTTSNMLEITLNKESLEYKTNGNCLKVIFCRADADATHNNHLYKKLQNCNLAAVGEGELTNSNRATGIDVDTAQTIFTVSGGGAQPYLVSMDLKLKQGLEVPQRAIYQAEVEIKNSVSTRNF